MSLRSFEALMLQEAREVIGKRSFLAYQNSPLGALRA